MIYWSGWVMLWRNNKNNAIQWLYVIKVWFPATPQTSNTPVQLVGKGEGWPLSIGVTQRPSLMKAPPPHGGVTMSMAGGEDEHWPTELGSSGHSLTSTHTSLATASQMTVPSFRGVRGGPSHHCLKSGEGQEFGAVMHETQLVNGWIFRLKSKLKKQRSVLCRVSLTNLTTHAKSSPSTC